MGLMSGSLRVYGRSRPRREARPPKGAAIERKQLEPAATDDGSGALVGGDATSSVAAATALANRAQMQLSKSPRRRARPRERMIAIVGGRAAEEIRRVCGTKRRSWAAEKYCRRTDRSSWTRYERRSTSWSWQSLCSDGATNDSHRGSWSSCWSWKYGRNARGTENTVKRFVVDISLRGSRTRERTGKRILDRGAGDAKR